MDVYNCGIPTGPLKWRMTKCFIVCDFLVIPFIHKVFFIWCHNMINIIMLIIYSYLVSKIMRPNSNAGGESLASWGHEGALLFQMAPWQLVVYLEHEVKWACYSVPVEKDQDDRALTAMQYSSEIWRRTWRSLICRIFCEKTLFCYFLILCILSLYDINR